MSRILGIDPGSRITGYGIVESAERGRVSHITSGTLRLGEGEVPARLATLFDGLTALIDEYRPTWVAVEQVFLYRNPDTALKLGQARGVALCAVARAGLAVHEYTPAEIKQALTGKGNAAKQQVGHMVTALLALREAPAEDAADALAAALCHLHLSQTASRLGALPSRRRGGRGKARKAWSALER